MTVAVQVSFWHPDICRYDVTLFAPLSVGGTKIPRMFGEDFMSCDASNVPLGDIGGVVGGVVDGESGVPLPPASSSFSPSFWAGGST